MRLVIDYVNALFTVYLILIFIRILLSWVPAAASTERRFWGPIVRFIFQSTDWFLNIFRRIIPPIGIIDLSPIVALIVLYITNTLVVRILESF